MSPIIWQGEKARISEFFFPLFEIFSGKDYYIIKYKKGDFQMEDTERIEVKVPQEEIVFIDMVFKSHEGLASLTVDHSREGVIYLDVTEGTRSDVLKILDYLSRQFPVKILSK